jgi:hypothetical protein
MRIDIGRLTTSVFFFGLVFAYAHAEALNAAAPLADNESAADGTYAACGYGTREAPARRIAQNSAGQVNDLHTPELDPSKSTASPIFNSAIY